MTTTLNASTAGAGGFIATSDNSGSLALQTAGTTAVTIDASQNTGFGITSPYSGAKQDIQIATSTANYGLQVRTYDAGVNDGDTTAKVFRTVNNGGGNWANAQYDAWAHIWTRSGTERMRIDSSGNLLVGTTSSNGKLTVNSASSAGLFSAITSTSQLTTVGLGIQKADNNSTTSNWFVAFTINAGATGSGIITANGASAAAFGSFSDSRLKENIVDLPSQLSNIMALRPVEFDYIESMGGGHQIGFIAQEVKEIYPDLVSADQNGMFTLTDMNKNDARLIKAIQELKAINDTQAETINALTARVVALESK